jgi:hypothetical protein
MFTFEEQYKKVEELTKQVKQINDFWIDAVLTTIKQFQKVVK